MLPLSHASVIASFEVVAYGTTGRTINKYLL